MTVTSQTFDGKRSIFQFKGKELTRGEYRTYDGKEENLRW